MNRRRKRNFAIFYPIQKLRKIVLGGAAAQTQHEVQSRLLLNVVVGQRAPVLELLAGEDEALLIRRDALLVLNLLLTRELAAAARKRQRRTSERAVRMEIDWTGGGRVWVGRRARAVDRWAELI